jgi:hypothetical protein
MDRIEQRFGFGDRRRIFVVRAPWRSTVDRRHGDCGEPQRVLAGGGGDISTSGYELLDWDRQGAKRRGCLGDRHIQFLQEVRD